MNATTKKTRNEIERIDGLYVPFTLVGDDGAGQGLTPGSVVYWGYGYPTFQEAKDCVEIAEAGGVNPPGILVSQDSGKRI